MGSASSIASGLLQKTNWLRPPPRAKLWAWAAGGGLCCTHIWAPGLRGGSQGALGRARGDASWQPEIWPPAPGLAGTEVLSPQTGRGERAPATGCPSDKTKYLFFLGCHSGTGEGEEKRTQLKTGPRPSILRLEDVGGTYIHLRLFLTCSLLNLFMRGEEEKTRV